VGQKSVEVGESLAEALPPQPLAHDVPEPRASRRLRRANPEAGNALARGRRERWGRHHGGAGVMSYASQVTEHPPVHVLLSTVPPAHRLQGVLQQRRRTPLVRLKCAAGQRRYWLRREDHQAEARQVVLVDGGGGIQLVRAEVERIHGRPAARAQDIDSRRAACVPRRARMWRARAYIRSEARTQLTGEWKLLHCNKSRCQTGATRAACLTDRRANAMHVESVGQF
jgi:hypothetical protein